MKANDAVQLGEDLLLRAHVLTGDGRFGKEKEDTGSIPKFLSFLFCRLELHQINGC